MDDMCIIIQQVEHYFQNSPEHLIQEEMNRYRDQLNRDCAFLNTVITTLTNFIKETPFAQRRLLRTQRVNYEILKEELGLLPPRGPLFPGGQEYQRAAADFEIGVVAGMVNDEER